MVADVGSSARTVPLVNSAQEHENKEIAHTDPKRVNFLVIVAYCTCCLVWGTTWFVVRQMVLPSAGSSPYLFASMRFAIGLSLYLPLWLVFKQRLRAPNSMEWKWLAASGVLNGFYQICVYYAEQHISGGLTAVVAATAPLMVAILAVLTKTEKVSSRTIVGFCASLIGVAMVCHDRMTVSWTQAGATMIMLLAAFFNSCTNVTLKKASKDHLNPLVSAPVYLLITIAPVWLASLALGEPQNITNIPASTWYGMLYLAVMSSFMAFGMYLYMIKHMSLMAVSTLPFVLPILALIVDLFLEKSFTLSPETWAGIVVVLVGLIYSAFRR